MNHFNTPAMAWRLALGALVGSGAMTLTAHAATFADTGAFSTPPWSATVYGNGDVVDTRLNPDGNPGDYLSLQTVPSGGVIVIGIYLNGDAVWNPATQGAVASIDMDLDVLMRASAFGHRDGQAYGIALAQNGAIFQSAYDLTGYPLPAWASRSILGVGAAGFRRVNPDGSSANPVANPDFSASGSLISFGLVVANSGGQPISGTTAGYDNWGLTVNTVSQIPEPAAFGLFSLGLAGLGLVALRRRRYPDIGADSPSPSCQQLPQHKRQDAAVA